MKITPINDKAETEGAEFVYRGNKFLVARAGNANFKKLFRKLLKPYKEEFDNDQMSEEESNSIMVECFAKTILVGWDKIVDRDGKEYEYSYKNAKALLTDDKDAYTAISKFSENINNYLDEDIKKVKPE